MATELRKVSGVEPPSCTSLALSNVVSDSGTHHHSQHHPHNNTQQPLTPAPSYSSVSHTPNLETVINVEAKMSGTTIDIGHHLYGLNEKLQALQTEQQQDSLVSISSTGMSFGIGSGGCGSSESTVDDFQKLQQHLQQSQSQQQSLSSVTTSSAAPNLVRAHSLAPVESPYATHIGGAGNTDDIESFSHLSNISSSSGLHSTSSVITMSGSSATLLNMPQVDTLNELAFALQKVR